MKQNESQPPNKLHGHPDFYKLLDQMAQLHSSKNHDYAGNNPLSNLSASSRIGIPPFMGVLVRLQDKWSRIEQFAQTGILEVATEKIEDTLMDNAVYSLLAILLLRDSREKPMPQAAQKREKPLPTGPGVREYSDVNPACRS